MFTPDPEDVRVAQNAGMSNVAGSGVNWQTAMDSGRAFRLQSATNGAKVLYTQAIEESGIMAVGDSVWVLWEYCAAGVNIGALEFFAGALQGDRDFTTGGWEGTVSPNGAGLVGLQHVGTGGAQLRIVVVDNNATQTESVSGTVIALTRVGADYIRQKLALKITLTDANTITVQAYEDGVAAGAAHVHTNVLGVGNLNFKTFRAGNRVALAKGESCEAFIGNGFISGAAMPPQDAAISYVLPDANGATNEWLASGGGTAAFGEWDDAFGSYSTTDYNTSTSTTAAKKTINGFVDHAIASDATVKLVGLNAASSFNGSAVDATRFLGTTGAATDSEKDITFSGGIAALHTNGAEFRFFATRGDASAWTPATVDSDEFYVRQAAAGSAREWRVYALGKLVWYEPAAAVATTQIGATHVGLGPGIF